MAIHVSVEESTAVSKNSGHIIEAMFQDGPFRGQSPVLIAADEYPTQALTIRGSVENAAAVIDYSHERHLDPLRGLSFQARDRHRLTGTEEAVVDRYLRQAKVPTLGSPPEGFRPLSEAVHDPGILAAFIATAGSTLSSERSVPELFLVFLSVLVCVRVVDPVAREVGQKAGDVLHQRLNRVPYSDELDIVDEDRSED